MELIVVSVAVFFSVLAIMVYKVCQDPIRYKRIVALEAERDLAVKRFELAKNKRKEAEDKYWYVNRPLEESRKEIND